MNGAEMFQEMSFLLEHGHAQATREWFLSSVDSQMCLQVP